MNHTVTDLWALGGLFVLVGQAGLGHRVLGGLEGLYLLEYLYYLEAPAHPDLSR